MPQGGLSSITGFVELRTLQFKRLHRPAVITMHPGDAPSGPEPKAKRLSKPRHDPLHLARYYQSLLHSRKFESRAALAGYLGVSRAGVKQVLRRLGN
jgi:hypothetical protein